MLDRLLVEVDEVIVARGSGSDVDILEGGAVGDEVVQGLAGAEGRLAELLDAGDLESLANLGVGAEGPGLLG